MDKFQQFKSKVDKIIKEEMKIKREEEKKNEKDQLKKFEKEGGVDNDQNRDKYMAIKFMNFYISQKIMYIDYSKKTGKLKNENDYMKQLQNSVVIVRKNKSGKIIFTKINFSALYESLDDLDKELPFNKKNAIVQDNYVKFLEQNDKLGEIQYDGQKYSVIKFETLKDLNDMLVIKEELKINFY